MKPDIYNEITASRPQGDELTRRDVGKLLHGPHRGTVRETMIGCRVWRKGLGLSVETPEMRDRRRRGESAVQRRAA